MERHDGDLDPETAMNPKAKRPKPPPPMHPLCPDHATLDAFLGRLLGMFSARYHAVAAVFESLPSWLRFLQSRKLIDADIRKKVLDDLLPMNGTLLKLWEEFRDGPNLYRNGRAWLKRTPRSDLARTSTSEG